MRRLPPARAATSSGKIRPELSRGDGLTVRDLLDQLRRFDPDAELVGSFGGNQVPRVHVGVGMGPDFEPVVVVADREHFPGRMPDALLTTS